MSLEFRRLLPKVFVSCGQHTEEERTIARKIAEGLSYLGYEPYVAVIEQTVEGLKNNLFRQLETSEYFLFIDFKREQLANESVCRGSLFTNQELAIASFLGIEVIGFQESGVKGLDGMMGVMQLNAYSFSDRSCLVDQVLQCVKEKWASGWKNMLRVEAAQPSVHDAIPNSQVHRFHFLAVRNLHKRKAALNCQIFPISLYRNELTTDLLQAATELKWTGYINAEARIRPGTARSFDAFVVSHDIPSRGCLHGFTDATDYVTWLEGEGEYYVEFEVSSLNFPPARCKAKITLGATIDHSKIELVGGDIL